MKFGVNVLNFGPGADPDHLRRWATIAAGLGFHSIWISDHVAMTERVRQRYPEPFFDPFLTLAWLASHVPGMELGTTVCVVPYRHPLLLARLVTNLDQLSGGRFILGAGIGSSDDEYLALGIPYAQRGRLADEAIAVMTALWTEAGPVDFDGEFFRFRDVAPMPPVQRPHPPVWIGGRSDAALRRAARLGQGWHSSRFTIAELRDHALPALARHADEAGRPVPAFVPRVKLDITEERVTGPERLVGVGSVGQVRGDMRALEDLGAQHVVFDWNRGDPAETDDHSRGWAMLATLADQVLELSTGRVRS